MLLIILLAVVLAIDALASCMEFAHAAKFGRHRVQSSLELRELLEHGPHPCMTHPHWLIYTSFPSALAALIHLVMHARWLPFLIFAALAIASSMFHLYVDCNFESAPGWHSIDQALAYLGMIYHTQLFYWNVHVPLAHVATVVCLGSLYFYFAAYRSYSQGDFGRYVTLHSLWHLSASLGSLLFAFC